MRGTPLTAEQALARVEAYRGPKTMGREAVEFTRGVVRDSLHAAPQPPNRYWISYSTSVVGTLVRLSEAQGLPLDRSVILDRSRIDRFVSRDCAHLTAQGRSSYRSRLDAIASALLLGQNDSPWPRATLKRGDAITPWTDEEAARVGLWASGSRPASRRDRVRVSLALSLGAGLRRADAVLVTGEPVVADGHGVHLAVPADGDQPARTVTVAAAWEREVLAAAQRAGRHLLLAPTRLSLNRDTYSRSLAKANAHAPAGDEFTNSRARNTWIVRHLAAGTPLPVLLAHSGLTSLTQIESLLPHVPAVDPAAAASFMRGARA
jgi:hypothetical protein